jgi:hypothetical protein
MKRIILTSLFCIALGIAFAQWNQTGNDIYYNNGNVGIGTTSPASKLTVNGAVQSSNSGFKVGPTNTAIESDGFSLYLKAGGNTYLNSSSNAYITNSGGASFAGTVGIGTASPTAKFNIQQPNAGWADGIRLSYSGKNWDIVSDAGGDRLLITRDQNISNGLSIVNGNIGIGTYFPGSRLEIFTNLPAPTSYDVQNWTTSNPNYNLKLQTVWNANGISQRFVQKSNGTEYSVLSFLDGNVGIGSNSPDARLSVNGTVHAKEVKVDLNVPGPDYVFGETYNLPSLSEVEQFIKENKHLPEVPSASEMEQNGINLSEMNMLLLKKIEELSLYTIEQHRSIEELKRIVKSQSEQIELLKESSNR